MVRTNTETVATMSKNTGKDNKETNRQEIIIIMMKAHQAVTEMNAPDETAIEVFVKIASLKTST